MTVPKANHVLWSAKKLAVMRAPGLSTRIFLRFFFSLLLRFHNSCVVKTCHNFIRCSFRKIAYPSQIAPFLEHGMNFIKVCQQVHLKIKSSQAGRLRNVALFRFFFPSSIQSAECSAFKWLNAPTILSVVTVLLVRGKIILSKGKFLLLHVCS